MQIAERSSKRSRGRPTIRTPEVAQAICEGVAGGKSLYRVLARQGMPSYAAVCVWLREDKDFQEQYAHAREAQADLLADQIVEIADGTGDVQRDRVRIEARMWYAGKLRPKKYGPKAEATTVNVGVGVEYTRSVMTEERIAELVALKRACTERRMAEIREGMNQRALADSM